MSKDNPVLGIIGAGQLGSFLAKSAKILNIKTVIFSDDKQGPAQNYSDEFIYSKYDDQEKIKEFIPQNWVWGTRKMQCIKYIKDSNNT